VENVLENFVGMVVLRLIRLVITPPEVSIPRERGVTSSSSRSWMVEDVSPERMAAEIGDELVYQIYHAEDSPCTAAP